jgi:hypothetical protein
MIHEHAFAASLKCPVVLLTADIDAYRDQGEPDLDFSDFIDSYSDESGKQVDHDLPPGSLLPFGFGRTGLWAVVDRVVADIPYLVEIHRSFDWSAGSLAVWRQEQVCAAIALLASKDLEDCGRRVMSIRVTTRLRNIVVRGDSRSGGEDLLQLVRQASDYVAGRMRPPPDHRFCLCCKYPCRERNNGLHPIPLLLGEGHLC